MRFTVKGKGHFPFDMLRYDACYPASSEDAMKLAFDRSGYASLKESERSVELRSEGRNRHWEPTDARWRSFMWVVTHVDGKPYNRS